MNKGKIICKQFNVALIPEYKKDYCGKVTFRCVCRLNGNDSTLTLAINDDDDLDICIDSNCFTESKIIKVYKECINFLNDCKYAKIETAYHFFISYVKPFMSYINST